MSTDRASGFGQRCPNCDGPVVPKGRGRRPTFCSRTCQVAAHRLDAREGRRKRVRAERRTANVSLVSEAIKRWQLQNDVAPTSSGASYWQPEWSELPDIERKLEGEWDTPPDDPLLVLLIHSDCSGVIPKAVAPFLAERLERLLPSLPTDDVGGHIGDFQAKTRAFIAGLRAAAEEGVDLEFW